MTSKLRKVTEGDGETVKTLVEMTAESMQRAFTVCLTERTRNSNGIGRDGRPEGKKIGIYSFANMVLRLLFQVWKTGLDVNCSFLIICSAGKQHLLVRSSPIFPRIPLLWVYTQPRSAYHSSISLDDTTFRITTSFSLKPVSNLPTINVMHNA